jgi:hypothetical protein
MKLYRACRDQDGDLLVTVNDVPLNPRTEIQSHCSGFECGYGGVGARQLALALLVDHLCDNQKALTLYEKFMWAVVVKLPREGWALDARHIATFIRTGNYSGQKSLGKRNIVRRILQKLIVAVN